MGLGHGLGEKKKRKKKRGNRKYQKKEGIGKKNWGRGGGLVTGGALEWEKMRRIKKKWKNEVREKGKGK